MGMFVWEINSFFTAGLLEAYYIITSSFNLVAQTYLTMKPFTGAVFHVI